MYEIILYDTEDGRCPVQELLDSLEPKLLAKILRTIDLLEINGPLLREPYSKPLENGIFELRTKQGSDITRVQQNMTQKDLSAKTGITQADISRIENGTRNPSLSMVKKLAQGLGMQLKLEFVPMPTKNKM